MKSNEMNDALEVLTNHLFGRSRFDSMTRNVCVTCGQPIGEFRNELSRKEYTISGMCQSCQDSVFGVD
jgi:uncharacterized CHY-type Zn-finger protein